jgi:Leucine-rich repeat (LRR) protein
MDKNKIKTLPIQVGELRKLDYLSLEQNQLVYVPPELGTITNLAHLR